MNHVARDLGRPIAVVNRFTVKRDADLFEREFLRHTGLLGSRAAVDFMATMRLVESPDVYVHLGVWHTLEAFIKAMRDETYLRQVEYLGAMVEAHADQAVIIRKLYGNPVGSLSPTAKILVQRYRVTGNCQEFERLLWEQGNHLVQIGGPSGSHVMRSVISPRNYISLEWSHEPELIDMAWRCEHHRKLSERIQRMADVETEESRYVAHQRPSDWTESGAARFAASGPTCPGCAGKVRPVAGKSR